MAVREGVKINHRVVIAMDALTASQNKASEPVPHDRQGFLDDASRRTKVVEGPDGNPSMSGTLGTASSSPIPSWKTP